MFHYRRALVTITSCLTLLSATASATVSYTPVPGGIPGTLGPDLADPSILPGKEYSHDLDQNTTPPGGGLDPEQVIAWDGIGGTADGVDYGGGGQVDAIANHRDHLFNQVIGPNETAHLVFSHDDLVSAYPIGAPPAPVPFPVPSDVAFVANGNFLGGAGELSYEKASAFSPASTQGPWAKQASINLMPLPVDVDGVELWGPEPAYTADADKYSHDLDFMTGTSVFSAPGATPYIAHSDIVAAVTSLLGPIPGSAFLPFPHPIDGNNAINLDALMVQDEVGEADSFDRHPEGGVGDRIIFSIRQIVDPVDPSGYYATGSELFVLDASVGAAGAAYLDHGGHLWDKGYALTALAVPPVLVPANLVIDINAIEAISQSVVPEPSSMILIAFGVAAAFVYRRRLG